jgi:hypothetical protein
MRRVDFRYNKRNPKKGIESFDRSFLLTVGAVAELQQKKSQKGN